MPVLMSIISSLVIFGGLIFYKLSIRFDVWMYVMRKISDKLIYGYGVGMFHHEQFINYKITISYSDPYSLYLQVIHALGIFGIVALVFFIKDKLSFNTNRVLYASCLILVLCGIGYSFMNYARLAGTAIVLFGLLEASKGERYGSHSLHGWA